MTTLRYILLGIVTFCLTLMLISVAHQALSAPSPCVDYNHLIYRLNTKYGEKLAAQGVMNGGERLFQIFANPKTRSWTLIIKGNGMACILAIGDGYEPDRILADPT